MFERCMYESRSGECEVGVSRKGAKTQSAAAFPTGREGVKAFIREEINGLLSTVIDWTDVSGAPSV